MTCEGTNPVRSITQNDFVDQIKDVLINKKRNGFYYKMMLKKSIIWAEKSEFATYYRGSVKETYWSLMLSSIITLHKFD